MSKEKESPTITMTEEQLERVIKTAVKNALYEMKNEEKELPGLEENELASAPATFSLIGLLSSALLFSIVIISALVIYVCVKMTFQIGFNIYLLEFGIVFLIVGILSGVSMYEINITKKTEVLNSVFNAIMAISGLIVAIVGAVFAYKAL